MKKPHLSIIIPVLNLWEMTSRCLKSLRENTPGGFFEVIVVDNGSTDSTPVECEDFGRKLFGERFRFVRVEENINFGPACNLGAANAGGELLFFLNNDTLLTKGWFGPLLEVFRGDPGVMAASPLCLFPDNGRVQYLGIGYSGSLGVRHPYFMFPGGHALVRRKRKFQALSGAALMVPSAVFNGLDGFFPEYANGFEDMDLCCRIRRAGGRLVQENSSTVLHWASMTPGRNRFDRENMKLVNSRCAGCFKPDLHRIALDDGFVCELTPWLEMVIRENGEGKFADLDTLSTESEIRSALEEHPLWEYGYEKISVLCLTAGCTGDAAEFLLYGATLFPDPDRLERLAVISEKAGKAEWARQAAGKAAGIRQAMSDSRSLQVQAENVLDWAKANNDGELTAIYQRWMDGRAGMTERI
ncbi:glycosyltransferase family 2 protein [Maridesulfovibrio sp. FT414]|uniref:glycosyltransferase family 2 protein n=1 Tax=Maridesulfovibrio sp. FT414 TaxID=2979469 RepID=UPI003D807CE9